MERGTVRIARKERKENMNKNGRTGRKERRPAGEKKAEEEKEGWRERILLG